MTVETFSGFLDEIKALEARGLLKVVSYSAAHPKPSFFSPALMLWNRARNRMSIKVAGFVNGRN